MKYKRIFPLFLIFSIVLLCSSCNNNSLEKQHASYAKYVSLTNYSIILSDDGISYEIKGDATNNYSKEFDYVSMKLNFYENEKIVKSYPLSVMNLKSKVTKNFSLIIENKYKDLPYKITVDFAILADE